MTDFCVFEPERIFEARQLFRIFKSFFEIRRIQNIAQSDTDHFLKAINIVSRGCYLLFFLFDNIFILGKVCSLHRRGMPLGAFRKLAKLCWMAGLSLFLFICFLTLRKTYRDESDLKVAALNGMTVKQVMDNLRTIEKLRCDYLLNFYRALFDLVICTNELDLFHRVLGKRLSVGFESAFGMSAALIHLYSLRRILKKSKSSSSSSSRSSAAANNP